MVNLIAEAQKQLEVTAVTITGEDSESCYPHGHQLLYDFEAQKDGKKVHGFICVSTDKDFNIQTNFSLA